MPYFFPNLTGIDPMQAECDDLKFKLDDMVSKLNDFIKATKKEDRDVMGIETEEEDKPRVIYLGWNTVYIQKTKWTEKNLYCMFCWKKDSLQFGIFLLQLVHGIAN